MRRGIRTVTAFCIGISLTILMVQSSFAVGPMLEQPSGLNEVSETTYSSLPRMAIGSSDSEPVVAVWAEPDGNRLLASVRIFGSSWSSPQELVKDENITSSPEVDIGSNNEGIIAWRRRNDNGSVDVRAMEFYLDGNQIEQYSLTSLGHEAPFYWPTEEDIEKGVAASNALYAGMDGYTNDAPDWDNVRTKVDKETGNTVTTRTEIDKKGNKKVTTSTTDSDGNPVGDPVVTVDEAAWEPTEIPTPGPGGPGALKASNFIQNETTGEKWTGCGMDGYHDDNLSCQDWSVPKVGIDGEGHPVVVWAEPYKGNTRVQVAQSSDTSNWRESTLSNMKGGDQWANSGYAPDSIEPIVDVNDAGDIAIAWTRQQPTGTKLNPESEATYELQTVTGSTTDRLSTPKTVSTVELPGWNEWFPRSVITESNRGQYMDVGAPDVAINEKGRGAVVWTGAYKSGLLYHSDIEAALLSPSAGQFGRAIPVARDQYDNYAGEVAISDSGTVAVGWNRPEKPVERDRLLKEYIPWEVHTRVISSTGSLGGTESPSEDLVNAQLGDLTFAGDDLFVSWSGQQHKEDYQNLHKAEENYYVPGGPYYQDAQDGKIDNDLPENADEMVVQAATRNSEGQWTEAQTSYKAGYSYKSGKYGTGLMAPQVAGDQYGNGILGFMWGGVVGADRYCGGDPLVATYPANKSKVYTVTNVEVAIELKAADYCGLKSISVDFGDGTGEVPIDGIEGSPSYGTYASHIFEKPGVFKIHVTAEGATGKKTRSVSTVQVFTQPEEAAAASESSSTSSSSTGSFDSKSFLEYFSVPSWWIEDMNSKAAVLGTSAATTAASIPSAISSPKVLSFSVEWPILRAAKKIPLYFNVGLSEDADVKISLYKKGSKKRLASISKKLPVGETRIDFPKKWLTKKFSNGRYTAKIVAQSSAGLASKAKQVSFNLKR